MSTRDQVELAGAEVPAKTAGEKITFSFGRNWQEYVERCLDPGRVRIAEESLVRFLEQPDLKGLSFLDIGCGSGLFSLAALRLGARRVVSVDVDPFSVESTQMVRQAAGAPEHWSVLHGSILDEGFVSRLEVADLVYAWGSLHHTGNMWKAISLAGSRVAPGGRFFLAIYNKTEGRRGSEYWLKVKQRYNRASRAGKRLMEVSYAIRHSILPYLIRFQNPVAHWRSYHQNRGMDVWTDIRDWLGGYPYEFARADEIFRFCSRELNLPLQNLNVCNNLGLNEFLFRR